MAAAVLVVVKSDADLRHGMTMIGKNVVVRVAPAEDATDLALAAGVLAVTGVKLARTTANDVRTVNVMNDARLEAILLIDLGSGNVWNKHHRKSVVRFCSE